MVTQCCHPMLSPNVVNQCCYLMLSPPGCQGLLSHRSCYMTTSWVLGGTRGHDLPVRAPRGMKSSLWGFLNVAITPSWSLVFFLSFTIPEPLAQSLPMILQRLHSFGEEMRLVSCLLSKCGNHELPVCGLHVRHTAIYARRFPQLHTPQTERKCEGALTAILQFDSRFSSGHPWPRHYTPHVTPQARHFTPQGSRHLKNCVGNLSHDPLCPLE